VTAPGNALYADDRLAARAGADDGAAAAWDDAQHAAALIAVDPAGLKGAALAAGAGPVRERWMAQFLALAPDAPPVRRLPLNASEDRLLGGLDLAATLAAGRPVAETGLLADADGGVLIAAMAERMAPVTAANIAAALDDGLVRVERDGFSHRDRARFTLILLDEGVDDHESPPALLLERLAFRLDLHAVSIRAAGPCPWTAGEVAHARRILNTVETPDALLDAINMAALAVGAHSIRVLQFCARAARASAALSGRTQATDADAEIACRLVLGPRAAQPPAGDPLADDAPPPPAPEDASPEDAPDSAPDDAPAPDSGRDEAADPDREKDIDLSDMPEEMLIEALTGAALANPLSGLQARKSASGRSAALGKSGDVSRNRHKGRPIGSRKGDPRRDGRLDILATLRAASPWQKLRGADGLSNGSLHSEKPRAGKPDARKPHAGKTYDRKPGRIRVRPEDFHVKQFKQQTESTIIFVVDASGSAAMNRMAEAKGAVERLLADCYARRDHAALIAFRGATADLVLAPTRSLVRARRELAQLPGGGGTPLAAGVDAAYALAAAEKGRGRTPYVVFLSDGRGNIARNGEPGRDAAAEDAMNAARRLRSLDCPVLFFDVSPRPDRRAERLGEAMGARYQPLPFVDGGLVSSAVRQRMAEREKRA